MSWNKPEIAKPTFRRLEQSEVEHVSGGTFTTIAINPVLLQIRYIGNGIWTKGGWPLPIDAANLLNQQYGYKAIGH
jgi:hypothetical protein